jgi:hypothetical protein
MRYMARVLRTGIANIGASDLKQVLRWLFSRIFLVLGGVFVLLGLAEMLTPLPFGIPLILLGATIILNSSSSAKKAFVLWGQRRPGTIGRVRDWIRQRRRASHRRRHEVE